MIEDFSWPVIKLWVQFKSNREKDGRAVGWGVRGQRPPCSTMRRSGGRSRECVHLTTGTPANSLCCSSYSVPRPHTSVSFSCLLLLTFVFGTENPTLPYLLFSQVPVLRLLPTWPTSAFYNSDLYPQTRCILHPRNMSLAVRYVNRVMGLFIPLTLNSHYL